MDNPLPSKAVALLRALWTQPSLIGPYVRYLPLWGRAPIACEMPWVSFGALAALSRFIRPDHAVFEYGGGGSTLWFARRAASVLTVESHPDWHRSLVATLQARGLAKAVCELHPISSDDPAQSGHGAFFHRIRAQTWDIILIDCYCGFSHSRYGQLRPFAFEHAVQQLKPGGIIVLDDSWMFPELLGPRPGWVVTDYVSPGPCRYGITSTAILQSPC
ncbi:MAG: hypothetical protein PSV13_12705 [Lacunisphaera sp.]|nr:hypothetical protein [Lacunisphaera sp.]